MRLVALNAISVTFATAPLVLPPAASAQSENCNASTGLPMGAGETAGMVFGPGGAFQMEPDRYRLSARQPQEADLRTAHIGFRTVLNRQPKEGQR